MATKKAKKAFGIEIVKNAVLNAITNSKINKRDRACLSQEISKSL